MTPLVHGICAFEFSFDFRFLNLSLFVGLGTLCCIVKKNFTQSGAIGLCNSIFLSA